MTYIAAYQNDRDSEVLSAGPLELVEMLYKCTIHSIDQARGHLRAGEIRERSNAISKASAILAELAQSLDHDKGGEISKNLSKLYDYMQHLLARANAEQIDAPLAESNRLLTILLEGWQTLTPTVPSKCASKASTEDYVATSRSF